MVNKDFTIVRRAECNGVIFRVVRTDRGAGHKAMQAKDTIVNESSGKQRTETRAKWLALFSNKKWKEIPEE